MTVITSIFLLLCKKSWEEQHMAVIYKSNHLHPYSKLHNTTMQFTGMSSLLKCFYSYNTKHSMLLTTQTADVDNIKDSTTDTLPRP